MILVFEERGRCDEMLVGEVFKYFYFLLEEGESRGVKRESLSGLWWVIDFERGEVVAEGVLIVKINIDRCAVH